MTGRPAAITVRSYTREITLSTPLDEEGRWLLLLVPDGSTDRQVIQWASETLPAAAVEELAAIIEREAVEADGGGAP